MQTLLNSAQNLEITNGATVAQTISRNGRLYTNQRNTVRPWRFKFAAPGLLKWADYRDTLETVYYNDRWVPYSLNIGATAGSAWIAAYRGNHTLTGNVLNNVTCTSATGTSLVLTASANLTGKTVLKRGDYIQPTGHTYPYVVNADVAGVASGSTMTVSLNRSYIAQAGYTLAGSTLKVGPGCTFNMIVTNLPAINLLPGQWVEFTGDFELVEQVA